MLFARIVLGLTAIMFSAHGTMCLVSPEIIANESGLALPTPGAATEARAMYGGLELALGLYFATSTLRAAWVKNAIVVLLVVFAGLALARGLGLVLMDQPDLYNLRALVYEGTSLLLGAAALMLLSRSEHRASAA